jgi:hypothetical protein
MSKRSKRNRANKRSRRMAEQQIGFDYSKKDGGLEVTDTSDPKRLSLEEMFDEHLIMANLEFIEKQYKQRVVFRKALPDFMATMAGVIACQAKIDMLAMLSGKITDPKILKLINDEFKLEKDTKCRLEQRH